MPRGLADQEKGKGAGALGHTAWTSVYSGSRLLSSLSANTSRPGPPCRAGHRAAQPRRAAGQRGRERRQPALPDGRRLCKHAGAGAGGRRGAGLGAAADRRPAGLPAGVGEQAWRGSYFRQQTAAPLVLLHAAVHAGRAPVVWRPSERLPALCAVCLPHAARPPCPRVPLQDKCEPPIYVSDRRLVKAVALMQVPEGARGW